MSVRRNRLRAVTTATAVTLALMTALTACGGGGDSGASGKPSATASHHQAGGTGESSSQAPLAEVRGGNITLTVTSARREAGGFVTVSGKVTNTGSNNWTALDWKPEETELAIKNRASMADATLVDKKGKKRYLILRDTEGRCLCTSFTGGVVAGETTNWYTQFPAPPKNHDTVDFQIADMPPATITLTDK
jgi:hypothetical protein